MGLKVAVVGGGSTYTPELVEGFARRAAVLPIDELVLLGSGPRAARGRRRARRADPAARRLARAPDPHGRSQRRPRRSGVHADPAPGRRPGGAPRRRDPAAPVRPHRPGDDRPRRVREGAPDRAGGPRHRRGGGAARRARRLDPGLHQPGRDRHPGAAGRRPSGDRPVQRGDRVPARVREAVRGHARSGLARPRRAQPPVVDPGGAGRRGRPAAGAARGRGRGGHPGRRLPARGRAGAARDPVLLPALLLRDRRRPARAARRRQPGRPT